jgi:hypothetical protein
LLSFWGSGGREHRKESEDQKTDHPNAALAAPATRGLTSTHDEPEPLLNQAIDRPKDFDDGYLDDKW